MQRSGRARLPVLFLLLLSLILDGCVPPGQQPVGPGREGSQNPYLCFTLYTVGGALAGAFLSQLIKKNPGAGAVIGGFTGATIGWLACFSGFSFFQSQPRGDYQEAKQEMRYDPSRGDTVVKITQFSLKPAAIRPGEKLALTAQYYIMTPEERDLAVTETRVVKYYDQKNKNYINLGEVPTPFTIKPGRRSGDGNINIPVGVNEGKWTIAFRVEFEGKKDEKELPVEITTNQSILDKGAKGIDIGEEQRVATPEKKYFVITVPRSCNFRSNPSTSSEIKGTARKGEKFILLDTQNGLDTRDKHQWHKIQIEPGKEVWAREDCGKVTEKE